MSSKLTKIYANFETQLAVKLTVGALTGSLSNVVTKDGITIATGKYVMVFNLGESNEEHLKFDLDNATKAMTNIVSVKRDGTEVAGALAEHRVGAVGKITNFVNLKAITDILNGDDTLDGSKPMKYDAEPSISDRKQVPHAGYVQDVLSGAVGTANDAAAGTTKMTHNQASKPRAMSTLVREQDTPDMTLKVIDFEFTALNQIISFAGGNAPAHINPALGGDIEMPTNNPANGETITITVQGTACVVTFVASIGATPGNVLIGGNVAATRANLAAFLNAPGTTNANQVAFTGAQLTAIQKLSATDDLSAKIFVRVIDSTVTTFSVTETMAGGGNVWTANTTKNRIDLVVYETGTTSLKLRKGTEAASPTTPTPTSGDVVLAQVYCKVGMTSVKDRNDSTNGYITDWYFPSIYRTDIADTATVAAVNAKYETRVAGEDLVVGSPVFIAPNGLTKPIRRVVQSFENAPNIQNAYTLGSNNSNMIGSTFKTGGFKQLTGAALNVRSWNSNSLMGCTFNVELYATSAGVPTGSALATGSYAMGGNYGMKQFLYLNGNRSQGLINIPFSAPVAVTPDTQYAVMFYISVGNPNDVSFYYNDNNEFADGQMIQRSGGTFSVPLANRDVHFYVFNDITTPVADRAYLATSYAYGAQNNYVTDVTNSYEISPASNFAGIAMAAVSSGASVNIQIGGVGTIPTQTLNDTVTETLDQAQTSVGTQLMNFDSSNKYYAQSFITGDNVGNMTKIDLHLGKTGAPGGTLKFGLYEVGSDGGPTGDPLVTWDVLNATINAGTTWYTFTFGTPIKVLPRHKYVIHGIYDSYIATNYFFWMGNSTSGSYNHGEYWANTNTATLANGGAGFRTYYTQRLFADIGDKAYLGAGKIELNEVTLAAKAIGTIKSATSLEVGAIAKDELVAIYGIYISNQTGNSITVPIRRNVRRIRCIMTLDNTQDGAIAHEILVPEMINLAPGLTFSNLPLSLDPLPAQNSRYAVKFTFATAFPSGSRVYFYEYK